jgi:hypothetical protein
MDNPEKLSIQGTQDEDKQNKNTTQYVGPHYAETRSLVGSILQLFYPIYCKYCCNFPSLIKS